MIASHLKAPERFLNHLTAHKLPRRVPCHKAHMESVAPMTLSSALLQGFPVYRRLLELGHIYQLRIRQQLKSASAVPRLHLEDLESLSWEDFRQTLIPDYRLCTEASEPSFRLTESVFPVRRLEKAVTCSSPAGGIFDDHARW